MSIVYKSGSLYIDNKYLGEISNANLNYDQYETSNTIYNKLKKYKYRTDCSATITIRGSQVCFNDVFTLYLKFKNDIHQKQLDIIKPKFIKWSIE